MLDEPTSFCDLEMSTVLCKESWLLVKKKPLYLSRTASLCQFMHRVIELKDGQIIKDGTPKQIVAELVKEAKVLTGNQDSGEVHE